LHRAVYLQLAPHFGAGLFWVWQADLGMVF
jgi:hypothetical protein